MKEITFGILAMMLLLAVEVYAHGGGWYVWESCMMDAQVNSRQGNDEKYMGEVNMMAGRIFNGMMGMGGMMG